MIVSRAVPIPTVSGRTIEGRAFAYAHPSLVTDDGTSWYYEQILVDAERKSIRDRAGGVFPLLIWHSRTSNRGQFPPDEIGQVAFRPSGDALEYTAVVNRGRLGDEMLELVRDHTAEDVSVSYKPMKDIEGVHDGRPLISRAEISLRELSLCPTGTGQHDGAKVLVMRALAMPAGAVDARLRLLEL